MVADNLQQKAIDISDGRESSGQFCQPGRSLPYLHEVSQIELLEAKGWSIIYHNSLDCLVVTFLDSLGRQELIIGSDLGIRDIASEETNSQPPQHFSTNLRCIRNEHHRNPPS